MNINRFGATLVAAMVVAYPACANDGGKGGGGVSDRLWEQQQHQAQEEQQQQEEEQVPEAPAESILNSLEEPAPVPNDQASLAARDFYTKVVSHLDSTIAQQKERLKSLNARILDIDHKLAVDFATARAGDKTTDDAIGSAQQALSGIPRTPTAVAANLGFGDDELVGVVLTILSFKATAESIKALEAARADMAAAGKAYGATID